MVAIREARSWWPALTLARLRAGKADIPIWRACAVARWWHMIEVEDAHGCSYERDC